ncbi:Pr6Pr family membrane protein [Oligoflexus tunisiensis]|uniref:Pr6Pr family membrane protein n=1 Tax=Oligoflexus tunisiensis TaxID=708132 RepID=UPI001FDF6519|nr:Pr6Pr family membrane protein [Oligoflexus tunisiensis]
MLRVFRPTLSLLILVAVMILLDHLVEAHNYSVFNFFCFFTNQSNLLVALFFLVDGFLRWRGRPLTRSVYDRTRGALILYMSMTTSIYWLFLHHLIQFTSPVAALANSFLHSGALAFLLIDWFWDRPQTRLNKRFFLVWLIYPVLYGVMIMALGTARSWYPYPFLNIVKLGAGKWAMWNGIMAVGIGCWAVFIILLNNKLQRDELRTR